ncbi:DUF6303 family protein [Streptomyces sp. NPDC093795]|uniref:DUF6303 family protein n=1 Tax=Streptomyces sp. NPDC093795 TaxID=3366051 RepID=UPI00382EB07A
MSRRLFWSLVFLCAAVEVLGLLVGRRDVHYAGVLAAVGVLAVHWILLWQRGLATAYCAQLAQTGSGVWVLYVANDTIPLANWPSTQFADVTGVPTPATRAAALAVLGFEPVGGEWEWQELSGLGPVRLLGALDVRPAQGVAE